MRCGRAGEVALLPLAAAAPCPSHRLLLLLLLQALYQHDAACRVIARLMRERDAARTALTAAQAAIAARGGMAVSAGAPAGGDDVAMAGGAAASSSSSSASEAAAAGPVAVGAPLPEAAVTALRDTHKDLSRARRKRTVQPGTADAAAVSALAERSSFTPHSASAPGITALAVPTFNHADGDRVVFTGGVDGAVMAFDTEAGRVVARCGAGGAAAAHAKRVTGVASHPTRDVIVSASADGTVKVWAPSTAAGAATAVSTASGFAVAGSYGAAATIAPHRGAAGTGAAASVTSLALHALGDYAATTGRDGTACFTDIATGRVLASAGGVTSDAGSPVSFTTGGLHPDGLLLTAAGDDGVVRLYDLRENTLAAELRGHAAGSAIGALAFSENGFHLATGGRDGVVHLWDLRHPEAPIKALHLGAGSGSGAAPGVSAVAFDHSGQYLAAGDASGVVGVWGLKDKDTWDRLLAPASPLLGGEVAALRWRYGAKGLFAAGMDRTLRVFETKA